MDQIVRVDLPFPSSVFGSPDILARSKIGDKVLFRYSNNLYWHGLEKKDIGMVDHFGSKRLHLSDNAVICSESLVSVIAYKGVSRNKYSHYE